MLTGTPKMLDFLGLSYQKLREQQRRQRSEEFRELVNVAAKRVWVK
jgi:hypothetical protein